MNSTPRSTAAQGSTRNAARPWADPLRRSVVLISALIAVAGSLVGSGALGGPPIAQAAGGFLGPDSTLIAPAVPAFSVWGVIYLGLMAYAVWQLLPGRAESLRQRRLGYPVAASLLLNAAWILAAQAGLLPLTLAVMGLLLVILAWSFRITVQTPPASRLEAVLTDGTIGIYLGWICVAAAANTAAVLVAAGFDGAGIPADYWAVGVLGAAGLVGVLLAAFARGRVGPAATLTWGLAWVAVSRLTGERLSVPAAVAASAAAACVVLATVMFRLAARRSASPRPGVPAGPAGPEAAL